MGPSIRLCLIIRGFADTIDAGAIADAEHRQPYGALPRARPYGARCTTGDRFGDHRVLSRPAAGRIRTAGASRPARPAARHRLPRSVPAAGVAALREAQA